MRTGLSAGMSTPAIRGMGSPKLPVASCQLPAKSRRSRCLSAAAADNWQTGNSLSLLLLVLRVGADDAHGAFAAHDLAVFTNPSDACSYLHDATSGDNGGAVSNRSLYPKNSAFSSGRGIVVRFAAGIMISGADHAL